MRAQRKDVLPPMKSTGEMGKGLQKHVGGKGLSAVPDQALTDWAKRLPSILQTCIIFLLNVLKNCFKITFKGSEHAAI